MKELKTKGSLTIVAAVCIVCSILGGMACIPAARGMNGVWHMLFPQYVESQETRIFLTAPLASTAQPARIGKDTMLMLMPIDASNIESHYYTAPAHRVADR
jgi:hypothetical protein